MKNMYLFSLLVCLIFLLTACDNSDDVSEQIQMEKARSQKALQSKLKEETCTNIQSGTLVDLNGAAITLGFNEEGYNYQAMTYSGEYFPDTNPGWFLEWKWNRAYLSNLDCDGDGLLDIANGMESYRGTGAWTTTKWTRTYTDGEGNHCRALQFTKYVAVPEGAYIDNGIYYEADGTTIGQSINFEGFEDFAIVQFIWDDPCGGKNGVAYKAPGPVGLGNR